MGRCQKERTVGRGRRKEEPLAFLTVQVIRQGIDHWLLISRICLIMIILFGRCAVVGHLCYVHGAAHAASVFVADQQKLSTYTPDSSEA